MPSIIGYAYEAASHCPSCAKLAVQRMQRDPQHPYAGQGEDEHGIPGDVVDREGNVIHPMFSTDNNPGGEWCDDCGEEIAPAEQATPRRMTNTERLTHMMEYSRAGALKQAFIIEAIRRYAEQCKDISPAQWGEAQLMVNREAWQICARECLQELEEHLKD